jgi:hypothetical protein
MDKELETHVFVFNPGDNGGESLRLTTKVFSNGDEVEPGLYTNQELTLQSYSNSASIQLFGVAITPDNLRRLANELDSLMARNR